MKQIILAFLCCTTFSIVAQTPYDSFALTSAGKQLGSESSQEFKVSKNELNSKSITYDKESSSVRIYNNNNLLQTNSLSPMNTKFISVDPMADKYPGWGAYVYCMNNPVEYWDPKGEATYDHTGKKINNDGGIKENYYQDKNGASHNLPSSNTLNASIDVLEATNNGKPMTEYGTYTIKDKDGHLPITEGSGLQILSNDENGISYMSTVEMPALSNQQSSNIEASIHSHPVGQMEVEAHNGSIVSLGFNTTNNSSYDKDLFSKYETNIVVGNLKEGGQGASFFNSTEMTPQFSIESSALETMATQIEFEEDFLTDLEKLRDELEFLF